MRRWASKPAAGVAVLEHASARFRELGAAEAELEQSLFEFKAITLAYHHSSRVMRDPAAQAHAWRAFEALLAQAGPSCPGCAGSPALAGKEGRRSWSLPSRPI